jgi:hypothetical protein
VARIGSWAARSGLWRLRLNWLVKFGTQWRRWHFGDPSRNRRAIWGISIWRDGVVPLAKLARLMLMGGIWVFGNENVAWVFTGIKTAGRCTPGCLAGPSNGDILRVNANRLVCLLAPCPFGPLIGD